MKKTIMLLSAAALVFAACQKEEGSIASINGLKLTATIEQQDSGSETKTYLDNLQVKWSAGDKVNVFTDASSPEKLTLTLSAGDGTTSGTFTTSETPTGTPQYAIYPASTSNSIDGSTITFTLPATQNYVANSFDNGANVAIGKVSDDAIAYKNVCGVLKLSLCGSYKVSKIVLKTKGSEKLCGTFTVNAASVGSGAAHYSGGVDSLTLNCVTSDTDGVQLKPTDTTTFYFVVPVGAFAHGFTAKVYEKDNTTSYTYTELSTTSANTILRSRVQAMPGSTILPPAYQKVEYLVASGEQYFDTGIYVSRDTEVETAYTISTTDVGGALFGARKAPVTYAVAAWSYVNQAMYGTRFDYDNSCSTQKTSFDAQLNVKYTLSFKNYGWWINDTLIKSESRPSTEFTDRFTIAIGALNTGGTIDFGHHGNIYTTKIWQYGDDLTGYFIPCCRRTDSKPGMYDIISKNYFMSQGTDDFTAGPSVI